MNLESEYKKEIGKQAYDKVLEKYSLGYVDWLEEKLTEQLAIQSAGCSASDVISKIKHLPESDFSEDGQLKLLRVCGNALGLYKSVKWMQKHS